MRELIHRNHLTLYKTKQETNRPDVTQQRDFICLALDNMDCGGEILAILWVNGADQENEKL